jgi:hypothetical protein
VVLNFFFQSLRINRSVKKIDGIPSGCGVVAMGRPGNCIDRKQKEEGKSEEKDTPVGCTQSVQSREKTDYPFSGH